MISFKVIGIEIELHWTFIALFGYLVFSLLLFNAENFFGYLTFFVLLFLSVFFHELMHSIVALSKKIKVQKIILLPIGGASITEKNIENPFDELQVAIAGPLFNFIVVIVILFAAQMFDLGLPLSSLSEITPESFNALLFSSPLFALLYVNLMLGLFNLLVPAFPMDGGRVLRALLSIFVGNTKATLWSTFISKILSVAMFVFSLLIGNLILTFISIILFVAANQEASLVKVKEEIKTVDLYDVIDFNPLKIKGTDSIEDAFKLMKSKNKTALLVDNNKIVNLDTISKVKRDKWALPVEKIAREVPSFTLKGRKDKLVDLMLVKGIDLVPVIEKGHLVGAIEFDVLQKALEIKRILEKD